MTLTQVSRALSISSKIGRAALAGAQLPESSDPVMSPIQQQMLEAVKRLYGRPSPPGSKDPVPRAHDPNSAKAPLPSAPN